MTAPKKSRNVGRKPKDYMPFERLKQLIQSIGTIKSRKTYFEWYDSASKDRIKNIPKHPNKAYSTEWKGWGDFVGTGAKSTFVKDPDDEFGHYRKYYDALRWAQGYCASRGIDNGRAWKNQYNGAQQNGDIPKDIPKSPELVYDNLWVDWNAWCGVNILERMKAEKEAVFLMAVCYTPDRPDNVVQFVMSSNGESGLVDIMQSKNLAPKRIYHYDKEQQPLIDGLLKAVGRPRVTSGLATERATKIEEWVISNPPALYAELDTILGVYKITNLDLFNDLAKRFQKNRELMSFSDNSHGITIGFYD